MNETTSFETPRLRMTPLAVSDATQMVEVLADRGLYTFIGGGPPSRTELDVRYESLVRGSGDPGEIWHNWIVRSRPDGVALGYVQATVTGGSASVAWLLGASHQGHGFAAEAAARMCEWLGEHGVERIRAHIHPEHVASQRVAARIGLAPTEERDDDGEIVWSSPTREDAPEVP